MLQNIRENTQGTMAKVIIILISIPFVLVGAESLLSSGGSDTVAEVDGKDISIAELSLAMNTYKNRLASQLGENFDPTQFPDEKIQSAALQELVTQTVINNAAEDMGMAVSQEEILATIKAEPAFQVDGVFSKPLFDQYVAAQQTSASNFIDLLSEQLVSHQIYTGIGGTGFLTNKDLQTVNLFLQQKRDIRYIRLDLDKQKEVTQVTEDEVIAFYEDNQDLFMSDENVTVEYLELSLAQFVEDVEVTGAEIQQAYDDYVNNSTAATQKEIAHIMVALSDDMSVEQATERLSEVQSKLASGESFESLAAEYSDDFGSKDQGGVLGVFDPAGFPQAFTDAVNGLDAEQVSSVVQTESGLHLIKVTRTLKLDVASFEEKKDQLKAELLTAKAEPAYFEALSQLRDISFNAVDLSEPAEALGLTVQTAVEVKRTGGTGAFANPLLYNLAYSDAVLADRMNSEVVELGADKAVVIRVKEHFEPAVMDFSLVSDSATKALKDKKATDALETLADELVAALKAGEEVEALAKSNGLDWQLLLEAKRSSGTSDRQVVEAAFDLPKVPEGMRAIDVVTLGDGDIVAFTVSNVVDGEESVDTPQSQQLKVYLGQAQSTEAYQLWRTQQQNNAEVEIY